MQLLKLRTVSKLLDTDKDLSLEVINELPTDPYRYIDEECVESFYKGLQEAYEKAENILPTAFKRFETYGKEGYYRVRNNYFFLFTLADEIKQELFSGNDIVIEVSEEKREPGILRWDKGTWGWEDKEKAYSYILWWEGEQGLPIRITQEIRTVEEQDRLYTQRRTTKGKNCRQTTFSVTGLGKYNWTIDKDIWNSR